MSGIVLYGFPRDAADTGGEVVNPPETLASFLAVKISQVPVPFLHLSMDIGIVLSAGSVRKH